jgi:hypothetical protein
MRITWYGTNKPADAARSPLSDGQSAGLLAWFDPSAYLPFLPSPAGMLGHVMSGSASAFTSDARDRMIINADRCVARSW